MSLVSTPAMTPWPWRRSDRTFRARDLDLHRTLSGLSDGGRCSRGAVLSSREQSARVTSSGGSEGLIIQISRISVILRVIEIDLTCGFLHYVLCLEVAEHTAAIFLNNMKIVKCYATAMVEFFFGAPGGVIRRRMVNCAALEHVRMRFFAWMINYRHM